MGSWKRNLFALTAIGIILVIAVVLTILTLFPWRSGHLDITEGKAISLVRDGQVKKILVDGNNFAIVLHDGTRLKGRTSPDEPLREDLSRAGVEDVDVLFGDP